jgi:glycosyltransferase involved in cell wall biosynthesis
MGNSFIEAMAAGIPVIATPVGGIVDFLKDRETGVFCQPKNPKSIAEAVNLLLLNPSLQSTIVRNASSMVAQKYDWYLIAKNMKDKVFDKLFIAQGQ